jgi:hypothetical protein
MPFEFFQIRLVAKNVFRRHLKADEDRLKAQHKIPRIQRNGKMLRTSSTTRKRNALSRGFQRSTNLFDTTSEKYREILRGWSLERHVELRLVRTVTQHRSALPQTGAQSSSSGQPQSTAASCKHTALRCQGAAVVLGDHLARDPEKQHSKRSLRTFG